MRTDNIYLQNLLARNNIACYIISIDELDTLPNLKYINVILNIQSTNQGNGSHWTAFHRRNNNVIYNDSYGAKPQLEFINYCYKNEYHLAFNNFTIQSLESKNCGQFATSFIHYLNQSTRDLFELSDEFINMFESNTKFNNDILKRYMINNFKSFTKSDIKLLD